MFNLLINCFICSSMILGVNMDNGINNYLTSSVQAQVIMDNNYYNVDDLNQLNIVLNEMLQDSHTMPAFGVSIHTETLKAVRQGVWLKLQYNQTQYVDDMPFDELLIKVSLDCSGFNIIRGNKGIYDGRCFYIDLNDCTMKSLYEFIISTYVVKD